MRAWGRRWGVLTVAGSMLVAAATFAGPPLITDDPETLDKGKFELNTAYTLEVTGRAGSREWAHEAPLFDLNYGVFEGVQLKFEVPLVIVDPSGGIGARGGIGDVSIGTKLRLTKEEDTWLAISSYPAVGVPLGSRNHGTGTGSPSLTLPVEVGRHFLEDSLFVYADGGYREEFARGEADGWSCGIAAEYEIRKGLVICGELRHDFGVRGGPDDSLFNIGLKKEISESATFIGAVGRSFNPTEDSGANLLVYLGIQWSF